MLTLFCSTELKGVEAGNGVTVKYSGGEDCAPSTRTSSVIHVVCGIDESITSLTISNDSCTVTAVIKSMAGCGTLVDFVECSGSTLFPQKTFLFFFPFVLLVLLFI